MRTGLVVKYAQILFAVFVPEYVHAVNASAGQHGNLLSVHVHFHLHGHVLFHGLHDDGGMALVPVQEVQQVSLHHAAYQYVLAPELGDAGIYLELLVYDGLQTASLVRGICRELLPGDDIASGVRHDFAVYPLCRVVEDVAHHSCVHAVFGVGFNAYAADAGQIEFHGAVQIAVQGRGAQGFGLWICVQVVLRVKGLHNVPVLCYGVQCGEQALLFGFQAQATDGYVCLRLKLAKETAHLVTHVAGRVLVVDEGDVLSPLYQAVEVVCEHGYAVSHGGKAESRSQSVGYERVVGTVLGQEAFPHVKHEQIPEVQATRFQHSHYLQTLCRFSMEGYALASENSAQEASQRGGVQMHGRFRCRGNVVELAQGTVCLEQALHHQHIVKEVLVLHLSRQGGQHFEQVSCQCRYVGGVCPAFPLLFLHELGVGVVIDRSQEREPEPFPALVPPFCLQCYEGKHEAVYGRTCQRIAHGDVHVVGTAFVFICLSIRYSM